MLRTFKPFGNLFKTSRSSWWFFAGVILALGAWLLGFLEQRRWSDLLVLGLASFTTGAMLVVAVTAFVKLLWPSPDLSEWQKVQELYLWQAAQLWVGEWPNEENRGGPSSPVLARLVEAVRNGLLARIYTGRVQIDQNNGYPGGFESVCRSDGGNPRLFKARLPLDKAILNSAITFEKSNWTDLEGLLHRRSGGGRCK